MRKLAEGRGLEPHPFFRRAISLAKSCNSLTTLPSKNAGGAGDAPVTTSTHG